MVKCAVTVVAQESQLAASGGMGAVAVTTEPECAWTATADASWISRIIPSSGQGSVALQVEATANPSPVMRQTEISVNGVRARIQQEAAACHFALSPSELRADATGASDRVLVSTSTECTWTATSTANWIAITKGANGNGGGAVEFDVLPNTGAGRVGSLTIGDQTFTVTQDPSVSIPPQECTFTLAPAAQTLGAAGGAGTVTVATACQWVAQTNVPWITITAGGGSGNGTVAFTVAANTGPTRNGAISVGGRNVAITQTGTGTGTCAYTVNPATVSVPVAGSTGVTLTVASPAGCVWAPTTSVTWLAITSPASGSGNGTVTFTVAANTGASRTGTVTIAEQSVTVNQAGNCSFTVNPETATIGATGGTGPTLNVTTTSTCTWAASSSVPWLSIASGASGTGHGSVTFTAAANTGPERSGVLTVAGVTVNVRQDAGCSYTVAPLTASLSSNGGTGPAVSVSTAAGCSWTATTSTSWLKITSSTSGTGSGTVTFTAAANDGGARMGSLSVAGQTVTVNQSAPCAYEVRVTKDSFNRDGGNATATIDTAAGCAWIATSDSSWIVITAGAKGSGPGTVTFQVQENTGAKRTGTLTIAGQTFPITQNK